MEAREGLVHRVPGPIAVPAWTDAAIPPDPSLGRWRFSMPSVSSRCYGGCVRSAAARGVARPGALCWPTPAATRGRRRPPRHPLPQPPNVSAPAADEAPDRSRPSMRLPRGLPPPRIRERSCTPFATRRQRFLPLPRNTIESRGNCTWGVSCRTTVTRFGSASPPPCWHPYRSASPAQDWNGGAPREAVTLRACQGLKPSR